MYGFLSGDHKCAKPIIWNLRALTAYNSTVSSEFSSLSAIMQIMLTLIRIFYIIFNITVHQETNDAMGM